MLGSLQGLTGMHSIQDLAVGDFDVEDLAVEDVAVEDLACVRYGSAELLFCDPYKDVGGFINTTHM